MSTCFYNSSLRQWFQSVIRDFLRVHICIFGKRHHTKRSTAKYVLQFELCAIKIEFLMKKMYGKERRGKLTMRKFYFYGEFVIIVNSHYSKKLNSWFKFKYLGIQLMLYDVIVCGKKYILKNRSSTLNRLYPLLIRLPCFCL